MNSPTEEVTTNSGLFKLHLSSESSASAKSVPCFGGHSSALLAGMGIDPTHSEPTNQRVKDQDHKDSLITGKKPTMSNLVISPSPLELQEEWLHPLIDSADEREVIEINALEEDTAPCSWKSVALSNVTSDLGRMFLPVGIGRSGTLMALVDSGATRSIIQLSQVRDLNLSVKPVDNLVMRGFGVGNTNQVVGMTTITIIMHGLVMRSVDFYVLDSPKSEEYPLVLATDFLTVNRLTVNLARQRISCRLVDESTWDLYIHQREQPCRILLRDVPCYAATSGKILAGQIKEIPVTLNIPRPGKWCSGCAEETPDNVYMLTNNNPTCRMQVCPGLISPSPTRFSVVLVTNNGEKPETVKRGDLLCTMSSVVDRSWFCHSGEVSVMYPEPVVGDQPLSVDLGSHLTADQQDAIYQLLEAGKQIFSTGDSDVGRLGVMEHRIELYDSTPVYQKPRRFPEVVNQEIEKQCEELHLLDIIEPSSSPWSSPVVPVRKKDGTIRLCIDYRKLNAVTKPDKFPIPNLSDSVFSLHGMRYFTSMDLVRGYYQLPLEKDSRECTAFSTPHSHWQFKRLSFGLKNAPSAFQREMQHVLSEFPRRKVIVYIDDVLIMTESFDEHLLLVRKVMRTLAEYGCKVKPAKCRWFCEEVEFLGHLVSADGLRKPPSYVEAIRNFSRPSTIRELREFLGFVNFQRKFVPQCSEIMKPLSRLTGGRGSSSLKWDAEMDTAFHQLKTRMLEDVTLAFPDYSEGAAPLELYTDASGVGTGACLMQKQQDVLRPIAYASMTFSGAQKNYSTLERELAAIRWGVKTFRAFLFGVSFVVRTDHQPLVYLHNMQIVNSRLARTLEDLSDFDFIICYTPGGENAAADYLSRMNHPTPDDQPVIAVTGGLPAGLRLVKEVPGGGDSLPSSLFILLKLMKLKKQVPSSTTELRGMLVNQLLQFPDKYALKPTRICKQELRLMQHDGQLMCAEALLAFAYLYTCLVVVHYGLNTPVLYEPPSSPGLAELRRVHLQCLAGVHYNPVLESDDYSVPPLLSGVVHHVLENGLDSTVDPPTVMEESSEDDVAVDVEVHFADCSGLLEWCNLHDRTHVSSVMVRVGANNYCALLDTGAEISCISKTVQQELSTPLDQLKNYCIRGLGSGCSTILGSTTVSIKMSSGQLITQEFAVVEDCMMPFCFIIGADCLIANALELDFDNLLCLQGTHSTKLCCIADCNPSNLAGVLTVEWLPTVPVSILALTVGEADESLTFGFDRGDGLEDWRLTSLIAQEEIETLQRRDRQLSTLRRHLSLTVPRLWPKALSRFRRYASSLRVENDVLVLVRPGQMSSCVVSFKFFVEIMLVVHHQMAHPGRQKLLSIVTEHIWHPSASQVAADVTRSCLRCQTVKVASVVRPPLLKIRTSVPFELVAIDLIALPTTSSGNLCCSVIVDHNSKWLSVVPLRSKKASAVASSLKYRVLPFLPRVPQTILSDNGPEFSAREFNDVLRDHGIKHTYTTPYKPGSNGLVERTNRTLAELLRNMSSKPSSWDEDVPKAVMVYNSTYHSEIGMSPSQYLLSKQHQTTNVPVIPVVETERWREGNPSFSPFRVGQKVLRKVEFRGRLLKDKLADRYEGPYVVRRVNDNKVTYVVTSCQSNVDARAHHTQLRPFYDPPAYIRNHPYYQQLQSTNPDPVPCLDDPEESFSPYVLFSAADSSDDDSDTDERTSSSESDTDGSSSSSDNSPAIAGSCSSTPEIDFSGFERDCDSPPLDMFARIGTVETAMLDLLQRSIVSSFSGFETLAQKPDQSESGVVLGDIELWNVSAIDPDFTMNNALDYEQVEVEFVVDKCASLLENSLHDLHTSIERVEGVLNSASFSGFNCDTDNILDQNFEVSPVTQMDLSDHSGNDNTPPEVRVRHQGNPLTRVPGVTFWEARYERASARLDRLRELVADNRSSSQIDRLETSLQQDGGVVGRSSVRTRAMGEVPTYDNVQTRPLEYRITRRKREKSSRDRQD